MKKFYRAGAVNHLTDLLPIKYNVHPLPDPSDIIEKYEPDYWVNESKMQVNEDAIAKCRVEIDGLKYVKKTFYNRRGIVEEEQIMGEIQNLLTQMGFTNNIAQLSKKIVEHIKGVAYQEEIEPNELLIPLANGDLYVERNNWHFEMNEFAPTPYRLPCALLPEFCTPQNFFSWLNRLFEPADKTTIQEFLGYSLIPSTDAQKALFLLGEAETGKSGIGSILEFLLGKQRKGVSSLQSFLKDQFGLAELHNKLVLYIDDASSTPIDESDVFKTLITSGTEIEGNKKYGSKFDFTPYARIVVCCNEMLTSQNDLTDGFYRRLLPIIVKNKKEGDRVIKRFYKDYIKPETNDILIWALIGLKRLQEQDWEFTVSDKSKRYLEMKRASENYIPTFAEDCFIFEPDFCVFSGDVSKVHKQWCYENNVKQMPLAKFKTYLNDFLERRGVEFKQKVTVRNKRATGYQGIGIRDEYRRIDIS